MKIIAVSDIHIPKNESSMPDLIRGINSSNADVLVLGGDIAPANDPALESFLRSISGFRGKKMYICGNHDLWTVPGSSSVTGSSIERFEKVLPDIYKKFGFHSLEEQPVVYKDVGFVGNIGWYDYSLARTYSPPFGTKFVRLDDNLKPTSMVVSWGDLNTEDWKRQAFLIKGLLGMTSTTGINDRDYIVGLGDDREFCDRMRDKLEEDISVIEDSVKKIVAVFHCVPFKEGLARDNTSADICVRNAYAGSKYLGEVLYRHPKVRLALWGHVHKRQELMKGKIKCVNMSLDKNGKNPFELEI